MRVRAPPSCDGGIERVDAFVLETDKVPSPEALICPMLQSSYETESRHSRTYQKDGSGLRDRRRRL
jgi:hypothetical protein